MNKQIQEDMSEDKKKALDDFYDYLNEEYDRCEQVLIKVKSIVSKDIFNEIKVLLKESDNTSDYKITNKKHGNIENDDYPFRYWVDQTENGGYSGDSFSGTISVEIGKNKYFEFSYSM